MPRAYNGTASVAWRKYVAERNVVWHAVAIKWQKHYCERIVLFYSGIEKDNTLNEVAILLADSVATQKRLT